MMEDRIVETGSGSGVGGWVGGGVRRRECIQEMTSRAWLKKVAVNMVDCLLLID